MYNSVKIRLKIVAKQLPRLVLMFSFCFFMLALAFKTKIHESMQFSALVSLFYLFINRKSHSIFVDKYFWFIIVLTFLIFIRPNNVFQDYKQLSYMLLGIIVGLTSRLCLGKAFYYLNLLFPIALVCNIVYLLHQNPKLSLIDPYNVIYGNKNIFGYFLAIATISVFVSIPRFIHLFSRILIFLLAAVFFTTNLLNGMRSGTIGVALALISLIFWKTRKDYLPYLLIILISTIALIPLVPKWHYERYLALKVADNTSYTGRFIIWDSAIAQIKAKPLWGVGQWQFSSDVGGSHNFFLDIWVKYGLLLGTLLQIYFVSLFFYSMKKKDVWSVTILVTLFTINQVESFLVTSWCAGYFFYIMGTALANKYKLETREKEQEVSLS